VGFEQREVRVCVYDIVIKERQATLVT